VHVGIDADLPVSGRRPRLSVSVLPVSGHTTERARVSGTFGGTWRGDYVPFAATWYGCLAIRTSCARCAPTRGTVLPPGGHLRVRRTPARPAHIGSAPFARMCAPAGGRPGARGHRRPRHRSRPPSRPRLLKTRPGTADH